MKQVKDYMGQKSMAALVADGWTEAEVLALVDAPRSKAAEWDEGNTFFHWPQINGKSTTGLFSVLTREEKDAYNAYHKKHQTGEGRTTGPKASEEVLAKVDTLRKKLLDKFKVDEETMTLFEEVVPQPQKKKAAVEVKQGDLLADVLERNAEVKDVYAKAMKAASEAGLILVNGKFVHAELVKKDK